MIRAIGRALALLLAASLVPVLAASAPAGAAVQPCTVTYTDDGGLIATEEAAPSASGSHHVADEAECGGSRSRKARTPLGPTTLRIALVDADGDGLDDTRDGCPTVAAGTSTGCPIASRQVALTWLTGKQRLQVQVGSPVGACAQRARIAVFRVRARRDVKVFGGRTSFVGRLRVEVAREATYYVTVPLSYASGVAECGEAESRRVLAPRG